MKATATCMVDQHRRRKIKEKNSLCSTRPIGLAGPSEKNKHDREKKQARNCIRKRKEKTICVQQGLLGSRVHLLVVPSTTACPSSKLATSLANEYGPMAKTTSLLYKCEVRLPNGETCHRFWKLDRVVNKAAFDVSLCYAF